MNCIGVSMWTAIFGGLLILRIFHPWLGSLDQELAPRLVARARHVSGAGGAASWSSWSALPLLVYLLNLVDIVHLALATMRILDCILQSSWLWWLPLFATINEPGWSIWGDFRTGGRCHGRQPGVLPTRGWGLAEWLQNSSWIFLTIMILQGHDSWWHDGHVWRACLKKGSMTCLKGSRVSSNGSSMTCLLPSSLSCFLRWGDTSCSWAVTWTAQSGGLTWCVVIGLRGTGTYRAKTTEIYNLPPNKQDS